MILSELVPMKNKRISTKEFKTFSGGERRKGMKFKIGNFALVAERFPLYYY